jgi:hypothetical protein
VTAARVLRGGDLATAAASSYAIAGLAALVDIAAKFIRRRGARRDLAVRRSTEDPRPLGPHARDGAGPK